MTSERGLVILLAGFASLGALGTAQQPFFVDPRAGVIDGRAAVNVVPVEFSGGRVADFLDPTGLSAILTPADGSGDELAFAAGAWFQPPPGRYLVWLQGDWRMSPYSMLLNYAGETNKQSGLLGPLPIGPAGKVTLPAGSKSTATADSVLELLYAGSYLEGDYPRWEISHRTSAANVGDGLWMPEGKAFGALWSRRRRAYVAISRPFRVRKGETVEIPLESPHNAADLVVQLRRETTAPTAAEAQVDVSLRVKGASLQPDLKVLTATHAVAVWYGLPAGTADLRAESSRAVASKSVQLVSGQIERVVAEMQRRPAVDVQLDLPKTLREKELSLELTSLPEKEVVANRVVAPNMDSLRVEGLPLALLAVTLKTPFGEFSQEVDLRAGGDGFVLLKPDVLTLRGQVFRGEEGHRATLAFTSDQGKTEEVKTDEQGKYEFLALQSQRRVSVSLEGSKAAAFVDIFWPAITRDRDLDFHFPEADFTVEVVDDVTGEGIANASVRIRNVYKPSSNDEPEPADGEASNDSAGAERIIAEEVSTDRDGVGWLPPLRRGSLEISASAEGYSELRAPVRAEVADSAKAETYHVRLEPLGATETLRLSLSNGLPAGGADVALIDSLASGGFLVPARTDAEGKVDLPRKFAGSIVLARHPDSAFLVAVWQPHDGEDEVSWQLPPPAGRRLLVSVLDSSGQKALPRADVALWIGGRRLSGRVLAWLTQSRPMSDGDGFWAVANLPAEPVGLLAWGRRVAGDAAQGLLDSQESTVAFPWPEPVEVRAVE
jgi:hypothetical protein